MKGVVFMSTNTIRKIKIPRQFDSCYGNHWALNKTVSDLCENWSDVFVGGKKVGLHIVEWGTVPFPDLHMTDINSTHFLPSVIRYLSVYKYPSII